jgi:hypothetical protein
LYSNKLAVSSTKARAFCFVINFTSSRCLQCICIFLITPSKAPRVPTDDHKRQLVLYRCNIATLIAEDYPPSCKYTFILKPTTRNITRSSSVIVSPLLPGPARTIDASILANIFSAVDFLASACSCI